jgi:hypothetical protein
VANEFIQAEEIVEAAVLLLQREIVLPRTVWRQADANYTGRKPKDDTITLSIPGVIDARSRTMRANAALVADEIAETSVPVQLTQAVIPVGAMLFILCQLITIPDEWENLKRLDDPAMIRENI